MLSEREAQNGLFIYLIITIVERWVIADKIRINADQRCKSLGQHNFVEDYYFPLKFFFEKYSIQFSAFFSFSWNCPWRAEFRSAELVSCIIYVSAVIAVRTPEVAGSNLANDHIFYVFLDTR